MTPPGSLVYLDSCVLIAFLKNEQRSQDEMDGYRHCFEQLDRKEIRAMTSSMTRAEILDSKFPPGAYDRFKNSFSRKLKIIDANIRVTERVQSLRAQYGLKALDATHLATALLYDADYLYSLDGDDLISLDGRIPDTSLRICKPPVPRQGYLRL